MKKKHSNARRATSSLERMVRPFTAMEVVSLNPNLPAGFVANVRDMEIPKNKLDGMLKIVNSILNTAPVRGTARELADGELEVCKLALNILKLTLQSLDSLCVCHNSATEVWPNDPSSATQPKETQE